MAGGKRLQDALSIMILLYMFGACIAFQIIITQLFKYVCSKFGMSPELTCDTCYKLSVYQAVPTAVLILLPLSLKKDMSAFRYVSLASIGALLYTGILLLVELPSYYEHFSQTADIRPAYWDWNVFPGCSITFFAYTCQVQLLPIYGELQRPSYQRLSKVINRSILTDFLFYFTIAIAGYLSNFQDTQPIVLKRNLLPGVDHDYGLLVAILAVCACVLVAFPVNYHPFREEFTKTILRRKAPNQDLSNKENLLVTSVFVALTCFISIIFPKISKVISIMSGLIAVSMCFLIPVICIVRLAPRGEEG